MKLILAILSVAMATVVQAQLIPAARVVNWEIGSGTGVKGGKERYFDGSGSPDERSTADAIDAVEDYGADPTGATSSGAALQAAMLAASEASKAVYLKPGVYDWEAGFDTSFRDNYTIRGAGSVARSFSTHTIGTGSKTFTLVEPTPHQAGDTIWIWSRSDVTARLKGTVISNAGLTLEMNVADTTGSGTFSDWLVGITLIKKGGFGTGHTNNDYPTIFHAWNWPYTVGEASKGATSVTMPSTSGISAGQLIGFAVLNEQDEARIQAGATPVVSVSGYEYVRRSWHHVTSVVGTTVNFEPALRFDLPSYLSPKAYVTGNVAHNVGWENLAFLGDHVSPGYGIGGLNMAVNCWAYNIYGEYVTNANLSVAYAVHCEIDRAWVGFANSGGSNHFGVGASHASGCLIRNVYVRRQFPFFEGGEGWTGNAVLHCYADDYSHGILWSTNHFVHPSYNLYEGNVLPEIKSDNYYGGESELVIFRNLFYNGNVDGPPSGNTVYVALRRFTENPVIIANVGGKTGSNAYNVSVGYGWPNIVSANFTPAISLRAGEFPVHWKGLRAIISERRGDGDATLQLLDHTSDKLQHPHLLDNYAIGQAVRWGSVGTERTGMQIVEWTDSTHVKINDLAGGVTPLPAEGTEVRLWPGQSGFQEFYADVANTKIEIGNYWVVGGSATLQSNEGHTIPASLAYSAQPANWPTDFPWPAVQPENPQYTPKDILPVAHWVATGIYPTNTNTVYAPQFAPSAGTYDSPQSVTITSATSGATIYYTTDLSEPSASSTLYEGPVPVTSTTTLKAIAVKAEMDDSAVATATYTIQSGGGQTPAANVSIQGTLNVGTLVLP